MGSIKQKAVINAEASQLEEVEGLVQAGLYRSVSEFMREAVADKLAALAQNRVAEQVTEYCAHDGDGEEEELVRAQAFDDAAPRRNGKGPTRAAR